MEKGCGQRRGMGRVGYGQGRVLLRKEYGQGVGVSREAYGQGRVRTGSGFAQGVGALTYWGTGHGPRVRYGSIESAYGQGMDTDMERVRTGKERGVPGQLAALTRRRRAHRFAQRRAG